MRIGGQEGPPLTPNLAGDREIENSWILAEMGQGPGEALDFGCGGSGLGLVAARRGYKVTAIDLEPVWWPYVVLNLRFIKGDLMKIKFPPQCFDLIINCSTVEHIGLAGRYGVSESHRDGDFEAMERLRRLMKPGGVMLLTIPVGQDAVFAPLHRVYGVKRLPQLLERLSIDKKEYWVKDDQNRWIRADESLAFDQKPSLTYYGVGLFVLRHEIGET